MQRDRGDTCASVCMDLCIPGVTQLPVHATLKRCTPCHLIMSTKTEPEDITEGCYGTVNRSSTAQFQSVLCSPDN